jgi:hypothetical protein
MLLNFSKEERELLATVDACIDIPRSTKPAVARKIYDNLKNLVRQLRGLAPILESRGLMPRRATRVADARALLSRYQVSAEDLIPRRRIYGDGATLEDACINLRAAAYARQGFGFEAGPMRYQQGQSQDPTASLRDDDDDFDFDDDGAWDKSEHERAAEYHRALASKAKTLDSAVEHFKAADLHSAAARAYPDLNASFSARAASKSLRRENCL